MLLFYGNKIKRAASAALAVVLAAAMLGMGSREAGESRTGTGAVIVGGAAEYSEREQYEKELAELDREKAELDKKIKAAGDSLGKKKEKLAAVKKKAAALKKKIDKQKSMNSDIEDEMCRLDDEMRAVRYKVEQSQNALDEGVRAYKERLRLIYVAGSDTYPEVLAGAGSFYDMLMRMELMTRVAEHDNTFLAALTAENDKLKASREKLQKQIDDLKASSGDYAEQRQSLAKEQAELAALVEQYGSEIKSLEKDISGYTDKADKLSDEYGKVSGKASASDKKTAAVTTTAKAKTETTTAATETKAKKTTAEEAVPDVIADGGDEAVTTAKKKKTTTTTTTTAAEEVPEIIEDVLDEYIPETETTTTTTEYYEPEPVFEIEDNYNDQGYGQEQNDYSDYDVSADEGSYDSGDTQDYGGSTASAGGDAATVIEYAKGMVGGSYVWAGEQYGATDCSGLVMLSYAQIGINLPHLASMQAEYGSDVARSDIQPGDLVFFGYGDYSSIYHVAMYIGDGKIVHAESTDTGIVISYLDSVAQYNNITCIKRLI